MNAECEVNRIEKKKKNKRKINKQMKVTIFKMNVLISKDELTTGTSTNTNVIYVRTHIHLLSKSSSKCCVNNDLSLFKTQYLFV